MKGGGQLIDWFFLALLVVVWGSSFALSKHAIAYLDASWIMALQLAVATLVLVPYAYAAGDGLRSTAASWRKFAWLAVVGYVVPFFAITWGMHFVTSGVAGLLMAAIPLFVVVLAHVTLPDEPLTVPKSLGFVLGFAGILVLIGPETILSFAASGDALKGELAILAGCLCYGVHAVSAKRLGFDPPARQSAAVCLLATLMGLAFAFVAAPSGLRDVPASAYAAVIGLGLLPTALATLLVYRLMERSGPSFVSYSNYLVPVFAVLLGAVALDEPLSWSLLLALVLVLSGIAISRSGSAAAKRPAKG